MSMQSVGGSPLTRQIGGSDRAGAQRSPPSLIRMGRAGPSHWAGRACLHLLLLLQMCPFSSVAHAAALCITSNVLSQLSG